MFFLKKEGASYKHENGTSLFSEKSWGHVPPVPPVPPVPTDKPPKEQRRVQNHIAAAPKPLIGQTKSTAVKDQAFGSKPKKM